MKQCEQVNKVGVAQSGPPSSVLSVGSMGRGVSATAAAPAPAAGGGGGGGARGGHKGATSKKSGARGKPAAAAAAAAIAAASVGAGAGAGVGATGRGGGGVSEEGTPPATITNTQPPQSPQLPLSEPQQQKSPYNGGAWGVGRGAWGSSV